jgi:NifU-like protein involved in Fe-S cluster formation
VSAAPRRPRWLEHLQEPRGAGSWPAGSPGVATGQAGDEAEGRLVRLQLRGSADGKIEAARFKAFGCAATLASASYLAERVAGLPAAAARAIRPEEVARELELPEDRRRAAELAIEALRAALDRLGPT